MITEEKKEMLSEATKKLRARIPESNSLKHHVYVHEGKRKFGVSKAKNK